MTIHSHSRIEQLKRLLSLEPHPEGGYYREMVRSEQSVQQGKRQRSAGTAIYFLVEQQQLTTWHRVASDEVWHFYEGAPLMLEWISGDGQFNQQWLSSNIDQGHRPQRCIPAGCWQRAYSMNSYTLTGCTVSPGFEFEDFEMLKPEQLAEQYPTLSKQICNHPLETIQP
ncbi:MAG: cupin domain-containing protein [Bacteroidota bacterium]